MDPASPRPLGVCPATLALVALLGAGYAVEEALDARVDPLEIIALGASSPHLVADGELHRLLANHLWHSGPVHLAVNLLVLAFLGWRVERRLGAAATLTLWCAGAVGGSALWLLGEGWLAIGASAGNFSLAGAWLALAGSSPGGAPRSGGAVATLEASRLGATLAVGALFLLPVALFPRAGHLSHLGGLLVGAGLAATIRRRRPPPDLLRTAGGLGAIALAVAVVTGVGTALDPHRLLDAGARFLAQEGLPAPLTLAVAGSLAAREEASPAQLRVAAAALRSALDSLPSSGPSAAQEELGRSIGGLLEAIEIRAAPIREAGAATSSSAADR